MSAPPRSLVEQPAAAPPGAVVDLFCGAGGLTHGLRQEGFIVTSGLDNDPDCRYPYERNNEVPFRMQDIYGLTARELAGYFDAGEPRVLAGCPPCQPFSAYNRNNKDENWRLAHKYAELAGEVRPDVVVMHYDQDAAAAALFRKHVIRGDIDASETYRGSPLLHHASGFGATETVKAMLEHGADVRSVNQAGKSALHRACPVTKLVTLLLDKRPDIYIHCTDAEGKTVLTDCIAANPTPNTLECYRMMLSMGVSPDLPDKSGNTHAHHIALRCNFPHFKVLLEEGFNLHAQNRFGETPIGYMLKSPRLYVDRQYRQVLDHFMTHTDGVGDLHRAVTAGDAARITSLVRAGADTEALAGGLCPLHWAVYAKQTGCIGALLEGGASTEAVDPNGHTPLHHAVITRNQDAVNLLLSVAADVNGAVSALHTLYRCGDSKHMARACPDKTFWKYRADVIGSAHDVAGRRAILKTLLEAGFPQHALDRNGDSLLHTMCRHGAGADDLALSLSHDADIHARNDQGDTPLMVYLKTHPSPSVNALRALLEAGPGPDLAATDAADRSILSMARTREMPKGIEECLINHGAQEQGRQTRHTAQRQDRPVVHAPP